jgi:tRNA threonylcarbamoyladenosine biosynthesis protein TsaB
MRILAIDTSCGAASVAAFEGATRETLASRVTPMRRGHAEALAPLVQSVMAEVDGGFPSLDAIAATIGPGSFTGIRIGVSAAKGLSEGAAKPLIAISRLAVLASLCSVERVHAVLDAGRGEFYLGICRGVSALHESLATHEELLAAHAIHPGVIVCCEPRVAESLHALDPIVVAEPVAADAYALACAAFSSKNFADATTLDANYLRRADAEMLERQRAAQAAKAK